MAALPMALRAMRSNHGGQEIAATPALCRAIGCTHCGGEPAIHLDLMEMIQAAKDRGIPQVMINTNGVRIARDDKFLDELAKQNPVIYFQFDGLRPETYVTIRGEGLLELKLKALDRLVEKGMDVVLVAAIERGVNTDAGGR